MYSQTIPANISGLAVWLISDSVVVDGSNRVTSWTDLSGNNNQAFQANITQQPLLVANDPILNNKPLIRFDGVDDFLEINDNSTIDFIDGFSIYIIAKQNVSAPTQALVCKWDYGSQSSWAIETGASNSITTYIANSLTDAGGNQVQSTNSTFSLDNYFITSLNFNGNATNSERVEISINNNNLNTTTLGAINPILINSAANIRIGSFSNLGRFFNGDFAEIIVFNKSLDNDEKRDIENYIENKYAPPVQLPDNIVSSSLCDTTISCFGNYTDYQWSTGSATSSTSVNSSGNYWVNATNIFGGISSDTITVTYPNINTIPFNSSFCENSSIEWNTQLPKSIFSFDWSDNSIDSILNISQPGQYYVTVTDTNGCFTTSDTINVSQDNFPSAASLGSDTSLCAGNSITLTTGNQTGISFLWSDNSTNSSLIINSSGQYWITATNANNCIAEDTINVTVVGQAPIAGFENSITCQSNLVTFNDTSLALGGATITQWFWNFGDTAATNDTAIIAQPNYSYADTIEYQINLIVTTDAGCTQQISKSIKVYPKPIVDFTNVIACQNDSAFFNDAINPLGYPITNYQWDFGDGATATSSDTFHIFSQNINYQVQLIATNSKGCIGSTTKTITVKDEVSADFNYSGACINVPITFTDNSIAPSPNASNIRNWSFFPGTAIGLTATKTYSTAGSYPVTLKVTGLNGCISIITDTIQVYLPPDADFINATSCVLDSFQLTDVSLPINGAINSWQWEFAGNTFSTLQHPKYILNTSGNSNILLKVSNDKGCVSSITKTIYTNPLPDASFNLNPSTYLFNDSPISFTPNFSSAVSYFWNVSDGNTYSDPSLNLTFINQGVYNVSLQLTDNLGCRNNSSQSFSVGVRNTDLGIIAARSTIDNDGFVGVEADLYNFGSTPITEFEILYELTGGGIMKETWNAETLPPNAVLLFKFSSKTFLTIAERENAISCITIQTVNTKLDDNISNNENCAALNSNKQLVADPYPNPADGDVTLPIVLTEDQTIIISVYDYLGKLIADNLSFDGVTGLNFIKIPSAAYSSGTYTLKISISDNNYTRKLIKQGSSK